MNATWLLALVLLQGSRDLFAPLTPTETSSAKETIEAFRKDRVGPYNGVLWFCQDGTTQPPRPYGCLEHGGGMMYGTFSPRAEKLFALGIFGGTILAPLTAEDLFRDDFYRARALVIERYLERSLDGWVLERAKTYRGFRQDENEAEAARRLLIELSNQEAMLHKSRAVLIRLSRALPYGRGAEDLAAEIRDLAAKLGDADVAFASLRFKIHSLPEPSDALAVDTYAAHPKRARELVEKANELAAKIRTYYDPASRKARLRDIRRWLAIKPVRNAIDAYLKADAANPRELLARGADLIEASGQNLTPASDARGGERNLLRLHTIGVVEELAVALASELTRMNLSRREALNTFGELLRSAELAGLLSLRERQSLTATVSGITGDPAHYPAAIARLGKAFEWARARLLAELGVPLARYGEVEPKSAFVIDDILRSGIMLPLATLYDRLLIDASRDGGHRLVGLKAIAPNVRGENPGLAVGPLKVIEPGGDTSRLRREEIVLLYDIPPDLPPVAGIITVGGAGSLSHLAMLSRNLGIPLGAVSAELGRALAVYAGQLLVLGVSAKRRVLLGPMVALPPKDLARLPIASATTRTAFRVDTEKLDLDTTRILRLDEVGPADAGVRVGPKAAELGRLRQLFEDRVSDAAVIPFGAFVRHVDTGKSPTPLAELRIAYTLYAKERARDEDAAETALLAALARFRGQILERPFPEGFEQELRSAIARLGEPEKLGVFVRSDTNVEDLREFTGAGLNLTVPNRVRFDDITRAVREVWTSPYEERSFRWRQRLVKNPEYVFPSVLLHRTVPSEISGVIVTTDVETYAKGAVTMSAAEGVGGVVDGGAPETLVFEPGGGVRLLSSFRSPMRKVIPKPPRAGVSVLAAQGREPLLTAYHQGELMALVRMVEAKMPRSKEDTPWDIEFGLVSGKAFLMQIRPLALSRLAATEPLLLALDQEAPATSKTIDLEGGLP